MSEIEDKINNLSRKIEELEKKCKDKDEKDKSKEKEVEYIQDSHRDNHNQDELDRLKKELKELKKELENLKNAHGETILKVNNNKEQIDLIIGRLNDIIKGYKDGDEKLQKEIDDLNKKLSKIHSQIDLLLKMPRGTGGGGDGKMDMSALNELMKKIIDLENDYKDFVERVNIDEIIGN